MPRPAAETSPGFMAGSLPPRHFRPSCYQTPILLVRMLPAPFGPAPLASGERAEPAVLHELPLRFPKPLVGSSTLPSRVNVGRTRRMFRPSSLVPWQRRRLWTEPAGLLRAPQNEKAKQDKHEHNYDCVHILLSRATALLHRVVLSKHRGYTCSLCHFRLPSCSAPFSNRGGHETRELRQWI